MDPSEPYATLSTESGHREPPKPGAAHPMTGLLGESPELIAVREKIERLLSRQCDARPLSPILLEGETGTGKGLLAHVIHRAGPRSDGPFVDINCAAIPETLLEAELFGFERGAFTDARRRKPGLFQAASHGTIFLDEVGLLPEALQAKLLKVIDERVVRRIGSTRSEPVDVWILAATNEDLAAATRARRFREDLYHRLAVVSLRLPPLRERRGDICRLAEHFIARACVDYGMPLKTLAPEACAALMGHSWPGNIRELSNVIERVVLLSDARVVTAEMLGLTEASGARPHDTAPGEGAMAHDEAAMIEPGDLLGALRQTCWNISRAAARLGISRNTLRYRIEKYRLRPGVSSPASRQRERSARPARAADRAEGSAGESRWERRRLALLRAVLVSPAGEGLSVDSNRWLDLVVDKVQGFGGRIEDAFPTGIVAVFGLEPVEDAPRRALLAAIAIQKVAERSAGNGGGFAVKVGIHVGQAVVGRVNGVPAIHPDTRHTSWRVLEALVAGEPGRILIETAGRRETS